MNMTDNKKQDYPAWVCMPMHTIKTLVLVIFHAGFGGF